jgi:hypothetical protein
MNWGTKLMIAMGLFMAFILTLSLKMIFSNSDALVEKDYYEQGINYSKKYDAKQLAIADSVVPAIETDDAGLVISFTSAAVCKLTFKRMSDATLDTTFIRQTDHDFNIQIPGDELKSGPWRLSMDYTINDQEYLFEKEIIMP